MAAGLLASKAAEPRATPAARAALVALALVAFAAALALPLRDDDFHTLYWARASTLDAHWLLERWYGGVLGRLLPKLIVMLGMATAGPRHEVYEAVNLMLHVLNVLLVERLARAWTRSRRAAFLAALLFAVGFGFYGKAVIRVSNLAMMLALTLTLWAFVEWQARRRWRAAVLWLLTLATHEITAFVPLLLLLAPRSDAERAPAGERWRTGLVLGGLAAAVVAALLDGGLGEAAANLLGYPAFALIPANAHPAADLRAAGVGLPFSPVRFLVGHRLACGLVLLAPLAFAVTRGAVPRFAVAWMFVCWLPPALMAWVWRSAEWQDSRYLLAPSVGACLLVAWALDRVRAERARRLLLAGLVGWSIALLGATFFLAWHHVGRGARWPEIDRRFRDDLQRLERTRVPATSPEDWQRWS